RARLHGRRTHRRATPRLRRTRPAPDRGTHSLASLPGPAISPRTRLAALTAPASRPACWLDVDPAAAPALTGSCRGNRGPGERRTWMSAERPGHAQDQVPGSEGIHNGVVS